MALFPAFNRQFHVLVLILAGVLANTRATTFPLAIPKRPTTFPLTRPIAAGEIVAWGSNDVGQASIPSGATNMVALAAAYKVSMGLRSDGTVLEWGSVTNFLARAPAGLADVVAISMGSAFAVALKSDGSVVAWGYPGLTLQTSVPAAARNVVAITAGVAHSLAVKIDGSVVAWGYNQSNCTNVPPEATNIVAVAAGDASSHALRADGSVVSWGNVQSTTANYLTDVAAIIGQPGQGPRILAIRTDGSIVDNTPSAYFLPVNLKATAAALSYPHTIAINSDRTVKVWNFYGNDYGDGCLNVPPRLRNVIAVAAGYDHMLAIKLPSPPQPTTATAIAEVINGFVIALHVGDGGEGYAQAPKVTISGGAGSGATAIAQISKGIVTGFTVTDAGSGYVTTPKVTIDDPPFLPLIAVSPSRVNVTLHLTPGSNYQLESSTMLPTFAPIGNPFLAQSTTITNEFTISESGQFFRFREVP